MTQNEALGRNPFLADTEVIDFNHPEIRALGERIRAMRSEDGFIERCFQWVKTEVQHSADCDSDIVTCRASDVLRERVGFCYAKSHLLVALLRFGGVPAGFVYQRLQLDDSNVFCLHGLAAVPQKDGSWYHLDPRGGERGQHAAYTPPREHWVFKAEHPGEWTSTTVFANPVQRVVQSLTAFTSARALMQNLPDAVSEIELV